jgi:hypothetical protein
MAKRGGNNNPIGINQYGHGKGTGRRNVPSGVARRSAAADRHEAIQKSISHQHEQSMKGATSLHKPGAASVHRDPSGPKYETVVARPGGLIDYGALARNNQKYNMDRMLRPQHHADVEARRLASNAAISKTHAIATATWKADTNPGRDYSKHYEAALKKTQKDFAAAKLATGTPSKY